MSNQSFVRKNGFTEPLNGYQIITWSLILITVTITNIVYIPNLTRKMFYKNKPISQLKTVLFQFHSCIDFFSIISASPNIAL